MFLSKREKQQQVRLEALERRVVTLAERITALENSSKPKTTRAKKT